MSESGTDDLFDSYDDGLAPGSARDDDGLASDNGGATSEDDGTWLFPEDDAAALEPEPDSPGACPRSGTAAAAKRRPARGRAAAGERRGKRAKAEREGFRRLSNEEAGRVRATQHRPIKDGFTPVLGFDPREDLSRILAGRMVEKLADLLPAAQERWGLLRVGTACSGTEAPVLGLELASEQARRLGLPALRWEQAFGCEREPFKAAYMQRNFAGGAHPIFEDITKLADPSGTAATPWGDRKEVPGCDIFISGTVCKDFSGLRRNRVGIEDQGQSGSTFFGAVDYLFKKQPSLALFENVRGAPWDSMVHYLTGVIPAPDRRDEGLVFTVKEGQFVVEEVDRHGVRVGARLTAVRKRRGGEHAVDTGALRSGAKCTYAEVVRLLGIGGEDKLVFDHAGTFHAQYHLLDTSEYGLPQTRNRGYMLVWRGDVGGIELGAVWKGLVQGLADRRTVSFDQLLLPDDHPRVARWRAQLRGPAGQAEAEEVSRKADWWEAQGDGQRKCARYRMQKRGHEELARPVTGWGPQGAMLACPPMWPEVVRVLHPAQKDTLDCAALDAALEHSGRSRDLLHSAYAIGVNQTIEWNDPWSAPGVVQCVLPGGLVLVPHRGRPVLGVEKLILQGIPVDRLSLGTETEVQLADLAGNAMSLPAVLACILAAYCAPVAPAGCKLRRVGPLRAPPERPLEGVVAADWDPAPLLRLAAEAEAASVLCPSESSGGLAPGGVLRCSVTGLQVSAAHLAQSVNWAGHRFEPRVERRQRACPDAADAALRRAAPALLRLSGEPPWLDGLQLAAAEVRRRGGHWELLYRASDRSRSAVLALRVGALSEGLADGLGIRGSLLVLAHRGDAQGRETGELREARFELPTGGAPRTAPVWRVREADSGMRVMLSGRRGARCYAAEIGARAEGTVHVQWPEEVTAEGLWGQGEAVVLHRVRDEAGTPSRACSPAHASCGGVPWQRAVASIPLGALWRGAHPAHGLVHLLFVPSRDRTAPDRWALSRSPCHRDGHRVLALLPPEWDPRVLLGGAETVQLSAERWSTAQAALQELRAPGEVRRFVPPEELPAQGGSDCEPQCWRCTVPVAGVAQLGAPALSAALGGAAAGAAAGAKVGRIGLAGRGAVRARPVLRLVAPELRRRGLPEEWKRWHHAPLGQRCAVCAPEAPEPQWVGRSRVHDPMAASDFERQMVHGRPSLWAAQVDPRGCSVELHCNPLAAVHRAHAALPQWRADPVSASWCVRGAEPAAAQEPTWRLRSNSEDPPHETPALFTAADPRHCLWDAQRRALGWMLRVEREGQRFTEAEVEADECPALGWSAVGRAERVVTGRGGVIADVLGGGKAVTTIGLLAERLEEDRERREGTGSCGTLVLAPAHLLAQWREEVVRFTAARLMGRKRPPGAADGCTPPSKRRCTGSPCHPAPDEATGAAAAAAAGAAAAASATPQGLNSGRASPSGSHGARSTQLPVSADCDHRLKRAKFDRRTGRFACESIDGNQYEVDYVCDECGANGGSEVAMFYCTQGKCGHALCDGCHPPPALASAPSTAAAGGRHGGAQKRRLGGGRSPPLAAGSAGAGPGRSRRNPDPLKLLVIQSFASLKYITRVDLQAADVVLAPTTLLLEAGYLERLGEAAGMDPPSSFPEVPKHAPHRGSELRGTHVPSFAAQPNCLRRRWQGVRDEAACFARWHAHAAASGEAQLRPGAPLLERERWQRLILDEADLVLAGAKSLRANRAARELAGVAEQDPMRRPLRADITWALTATPRLSPEVIAELASLTAGVHVCGSGRHWATLERRSDHDVFLEHQRPPPSTFQLQQAHHSAAAYLDAFVRRNESARVGAELRIMEHPARLTGREAELLREALGGNARGAGGLLADPSKLQRDPRDWALAICAGAAALEAIAARAPPRKLLVLAPGSPRRVFEAARRAVERLHGACVLSAEPADAQGETLQQFGSTAAEGPRVLLLRFEEAVGANLQRDCCELVLFAPLYHEDDGYACARITQGVGRLWRPGQPAPAVTVHRILAEGPAGESTLEAVLQERGPLPEAAP